MSIFNERYRKPGTPLAVSASGGSSDVRQPDFADWILHVHPELLSELETLADTDGLTRSEHDALRMGSDGLLCCPEDHRCIGSCAADRVLCRRCEIPVCSCCSKKLRGNELPAIALINDYWMGYVDAWIYKTGGT